MGRAKKVFAPLNDKYAGKSIMPGTFLWFVSFVDKKAGAVWKSFSSPERARTARIKRNEQHCQYHEPVE